MQRSLLIYNPAAGQWWRRPDPERVRAALAREGYDAELLVTRGQDHATELVRQHLSPEIGVVWVCGGDGTVSQAATALVDSAVPIGILPIGTVNVIALECGIPSDPFRAIARLARSREHRTFRTWAVGGRAVLLGLGVGFEARAIGGTDPRLKAWGGFLAVGAHGVREWWRYDFPPLHVTGEDERGEPFSHWGTQLLVTNPRHYAGHHVVAPDADPAGETLEVVLFRGRSRARLARFWAGVELPGSLHLRVPGVSLHRARRLRIESEDGRAIETHLNGDAVETTPVEVEPWGSVRFLTAGA